MGKASKQDAPDYSPVAAANEESSRIAAQVAREQLAWAKEQYATDRVTSDRVVDRLLGTMDSESEAAAADRKRYQDTFQGVEDQFVKESQADRQRYEQVFRPLEDQVLQQAQQDNALYRGTIRPMEEKFIQDAKNFNTPQRQNEEAARAASDVAQAFDGQRKSALAQLESYGIDPSQARAGALDNNVRVLQAATSATAQTNARRTVEETGRQLTGQAIQLGQSYRDGVTNALPLAGNAAGGTANAVNLGRGYPGQIASGYQTAQGAGQGAVSSTLGTTASGASTLGTSTQYMGLNNQALGNWGGNLSGQINTVNTNNAAADRQNSSQLTNIVGTVAGVALGAVTGGVGTAALAGLAGAASAASKKGP